MLRIATFNLESLESGARAGAPLAERATILRPQLRRLRADILCLQEVNGQDGKGSARRLRALDQLLEGTPYAFFHQLSSRNRRGDKVVDRHNVVTLSRLPMAAQGQFWHDLVEPPLYRPVTAFPPMAAPQPVEWDRPAVYAAITLAGGRLLHLFNLHLRAPRAAFVPGQKLDRATWASVGGWAEGFFLAALKRAGQALEVRLAIERLFDEEPDALIAVCGDFNAQDHEMPLRTLCGDEDDTGNGHLAARMLVPVDRGIPADQRHSVTHHGRPVMIDHILVSRPLLAYFRHAEIHNEALGDEVISPSRNTASPETYHAPLVAEFDLEE